MDAQDRVRSFQDEHDVVGEPEYQLLDLASEVGELAADACAATDYGTGDGDVVTTDVTGDLDASTGDGDVTVERTDGAVTARTGDGDLVVRGPGSVGDLRTGDGDLTAEMPAVDGSATIVSDDGDVTLSLGDALDATIDATTGDGEVSATAAGFGSVGTVTETHVVGTVGDGTNELRVHAGDGDVTLARLS